MLSNLHVWFVDSLKPSKGGLVKLRWWKSIIQGHTLGVQHPLNGARQTGRRPLHYELEAIIADQRDVLGCCLWCLRHDCCAARMRVYKEKSQSPAGCWQKDEEPLPSLSLFDPSFNRPSCTLPTSLLSSKFVVAYSKMSQYCRVKHNHRRPHGHFLFCCIIRT